MESHGGRSPETPRGVGAPEQRTVSPSLPDLLLDPNDDDNTVFHRIYLGQISPTTSRRPSCPVRVHSRFRMAIVTPSAPQTCPLQPITSSGPIRTTNIMRNSSRTSGNVRRIVADISIEGMGTISTIPSSNARTHSSTMPSSNARTHSATMPSSNSQTHGSTMPSSNSQTHGSTIPSTPILSGRSHSLSTNRLQNSNMFSNSLTNSATRSRTGVGSVSSSVEAVSLTLPRPEAERSVNEYIETPIRSGLSLFEPKLEPSHRTIWAPSLNNGIFSDDSSPGDSHFAMVTLPVTGFGRHSKHGGRSSLRHGEEKVVTSQPSATFKKERFQSDSQCSRQNDDIICSECKRCRCESCRTPRPLPSKWLCGTCHCSADAIVDYTTCLCCAKAFFYHFSNDETASYESDPCSCSSDMLLARWGCLGVMSFFLPCLFCYWPCRGLVQICEACYQYYSSHGCRCQKLYQQPTPLTFEKRLLDSAE